MPTDMRRLHGQSDVKSGRSRGVIGLITVIILGAIILAVGLAASHAAQTEMLMAADADRGTYARQLASSCLEEALLRLKKDSTYVGGVVPINLSYSCQVTVSGVGASRTVTATATDDTSTKVLEVQVDLRTNGPANAHSWYVSAWQEVDP